MSEKSQKSEQQANQWQVFCQLLNQLFRLWQQKDIETYKLINMDAYWYTYAYIWTQVSYVCNCIDCDSITHGLYRQL